MAFWCTSIFKSVGPLLCRRHPDSSLFIHVTHMSLDTTSDATHVTPLTASWLSLSSSQTSCPLTWKDIRKIRPCFTVYRSAECFLSTSCLPSHSHLSILRSFTQHYTSLRIDEHKLIYFSVFMAITYLEMKRFSLVVGLRPQMLLKGLQRGISQRTTQI